VRRHFDVEFKRRGGGVSTRNSNGAAAFTRRRFDAEFQMALRRFDAEFKRCGGISTRNLNGAAGHFDSGFKRRGGI
jgi:hypothetical protein